MAEQKQKVEEKQAQTIAATQSGGAYPPADVEPSKAEQKQQEEAVSASVEVQNKLDALDRDTLVRLSAAVDDVLRNRGQDAPGAGGPSLREISSGLPVHEDATADVDVKQVAKAVDGDADNVVSFAVRQARTHDGRAVGPKYYSVVFADGSKEVAAA